MCIIFILFVASRQSPIAIINFESIILPSSQSEFPFFISHLFKSSAISAIYLANACLRICIWLFRSTHDVVRVMIPHSSRWHLNCFGGSKEALIRLFIFSLITFCLNIIQHNFMVGEGSQGGRDNRLFFKQKKRHFSTQIVSYLRTHLFRSGLKQMLRGHSIS